MIPEYINFINVLENNFPNYYPNIIFDIGSRECNESVQFSKKFPNAKIFAFEPNPYQYDECKNNIRNYNNISFFPIALSDFENTAEFHITRGNVGASSLLNPTYVPFASSQDTETIQVPVTTLDMWTSENHINNIDILWMDVQGNELNVLNGAKSILHNTSIINTEVGLKAYYEAHTMKSDIFLFLEDMGFQLIHEQAEWECEANVIFINKKHFKIS